MGHDDGGSERRLGQSRSSCDDSSAVDEFGRRELDSVGSACMWTLMKRAVQNRQVQNQCAATPVDTGIPRTAVEALCMRA